MDTKKIFYNMNRFLLITLILATASISSFSQKINKDEIDKFTKQRIIETTSEAMYKQNYMASGYTNIFSCAIRKINDTYEMPANILTKEVEKYTNGDGVTFLLDNDETVFLPSSYTGLSGKKYAQGYWFETCYPINSDQAELLKKHKITSIRITYLGGHYDHDVKGKDQNKIIKMFELVDRK